MNAILSRTRALSPAARLAFVLALAMLLGGICSSGCASDPEIVAKGPDWSWTRAELAEAYDRTHGEGRWQRAKLDERQRFLRTVVNREILIREAERAIPQLAREDTRKIATRTEMRRIQDYNRRLETAWRPDSAQQALWIERLSRELHAEVIQMSWAAEGESCRAFLDRGGSFAEAFERFQTRPHRTAGPDIGWRPPSYFPPRVMRPVFLDDLATGDRTPPIATVRGVWLVRALEYRPLDLSAQPVLLGRTRERVRELLYRDAHLARRDSLRAAHRVETSPENFPVLARAVRAHLDSLRQALPDQLGSMPWKARGAYWRMAPEERALPLFSIDGEVVSAEGAARILDGLDLRFWPESEASFPLEREMLAVIDRLLSLRHAEELGWTRSEESEEPEDAIRADVLLDRFHDEVLLPSVRATPAEAESLYQLDPARWKIPERVEFSVVTFPQDAGELAAEFADRVRSAGSPDVWLSEATRLSDAPDGVGFVRSTDILDLGKRTDPPEWAEFLRISAGAPAGELIGPVAFGDAGELAVIRVILRLPERPLDRQTGLIMAQREVRILGVDSRMAEVVRAAESREGVRIYPERLDQKDASPR